MGTHLPCRAKVDGVADMGKALLEEDAVIFRGKDDERVVVRFVDSREAAVEGDWLIYGPLELELGAKQATKWLKAISTPKSVLEKLGVKSGQTAVLLGEYPHEFEDELRKKGVLTTNRPLRTLPELVFLFLTSSKQLTRLPQISDTGALWLIRPKGKTAPITEAQSRAAGLAAGLVDMKVISFSPTHSGEKFVVPAKSRGTRG